jgi:hypothetical protein
LPYLGQFGIAASHRSLPISLRRNNTFPKRGVSPRARTRFRSSNSADQLEAIGGVVNITTKSGTNTWEAGAMAATPRPTTPASVPPRRC